MQTWRLLYFSYAVFSAFDSSDNIPPWIRCTSFSKFTSYASFRKISENTFPMWNMCTFTWVIHINHVFLINEILLVVFLNYLSIKLFKKTWITPSGKIVSLWLLISVSSLSHVCKMFNLHYIISMVHCSCSILRVYLQDMVNSNTTKSKVKMKTDLVRESSQRNLVYCDYRECTKKATS